MTTISKTQRFVVTVPGPTIQTSVRVMQADQAAKWRFTASEEAKPILGQEPNSCATIQDCGKGNIG